MTFKFKMAASVLVLSLAFVAPTRAQTGLTYVPLGYCQITSLSSAKALSSCSGGIPVGSTAALISVEGSNIRYRDDGIAPTSSVGMPLVEGQAFWYSGTISNLQFIQQTSGASIDVLFYR